MFSSVFITKCQVVKWSFIILVMSAFVLLFSGRKYENEVE